MKKILITLSVAAAGLLTSCQDYLDINYDPNSPSQENITADMLFPAAEINLASSYGSYLRTVGGYYAQHYAQQFGTSNYEDYSKFLMSAVRSSSTYTQLNLRVLGTLENVREIASAEEDWGTYLAATTLRAFTYQTLVDCYESVPYTEALNPAIPSPKFDEGLDVYKGIVAELDDALSKAVDTDLVCENFLYPSADAGEWIRLANAVKFKILMRMSGAADVQAALDAVVTENNFPVADAAWKGCWANENGKSNPFYAEEISSWGKNQQDVCLNLALQATMSSYDDPRLATYFNANGSGSWFGAPSGTNMATSSYGAADFCRPAISYDSPVYLMTVSEVEFFLAEYHAKKGSMGDAKAHYEAAVEASFATSGVSGASAIYNGTWAWSDSDYKKVIGVQKWVALAGTNNFEAWCEVRRLGYPEVSSQKGTDFYNEQSGDFDATSYTVATIYMPVSANTSLNRQVLQRFPFAESASSRNSNTPAYKGDGTPMFWAE